MTKRDTIYGLPIQEPMINITITISAENKEKLDKVRGELISRSKIITLALEEFLKDHPEPLLKLRA